MYFELLKSLKNSNYNLLFQVCSHPFSLMSSFWLRCWRPPDVLCRQGYQVSFYSWCLISREMKIPRWTAVMPADVIADKLLSSVCVSMSWHETGGVPKCSVHNKRTFKSTINLSQAQSKTRRKFCGYKEPTPSIPLTVTFPLNYTFINTSPV